MTVREMLRDGDFNVMDQEEQPDGTLKVTLSKHSDPKTYKMWVRDLYQESEVVMREEIT